MRVHLAHGPAGEATVAPFADQDSSLIMVFAQANALVRRPAGAGAVTAGELVETLALGRL
jgi:molybdopterin molybdotransferase